MSIDPAVAFSWAMGIIGLAFLLLSLAAAFREVFPSSEQTDQLRRAGAEEYANLIAQVGKLKTWLALVIVGTALMFLSGLAPSLEKRMLGPASPTHAKAQN